MERRALTRIASNVGSVKLPPHVSIRDNVFTLVDDAGNEIQVGTELNVVVLDMNENMSRMYWGDRPYDRNNPGPPLCFSDNGIAPSSRAEEPQARFCKPDRTGENGCRWSTWESSVSKLTGKNVPACQNGVKLALMMVKPEKKDWAPAISKAPGAVFFLRVPPASLGAISAYGRTVASLGKLSLPWTGEEVPPDLPLVITRISFEGTGKLAFKAVGYINEQIDKVVEAIDQGKVDTAVGRDDEPITGALPDLRPADVIRAADKLGQPSNGGQNGVAKPAIEAPSPRGRGRPKKENAPAAPAAKPGGIRERAEPGFQPREDARFVTGQDVRDQAAQKRQADFEEMAADAGKAARQAQEAKEAEAFNEQGHVNADFGVVESAPEPPADVLDQFMGLELK